MAINRYNEISHIDMLRPTAPPVCPGRRKKLRSTLIGIERISKLSRNRFGLPDNIATNTLTIANMKRIDHILDNPIDIEKTSPTAIPMKQNNANSLNLNLSVDIVVNGIPIS